jgi:hypothetical protein
MTTHSHHRSRRAYQRLVRSVSRCLWNVDPESIGSTIHGPDDEYDEAAARLVGRLVLSASASEVAVLLDEVYPAHARDLADCVWRAVSAFKSEIPNWEI